MLKVNIPQLEVGDVVHSLVRTVIHRAIIEGQFSDSNLFEDSGVIRHMTYEVYEPGEKPLKNIVLRDEVPGTVKRSSEKLAGNVTLHRWEVTDVPRMFEEASMPPGMEVLQRLLVSTSPDWEYVSKWYYNLCRPHLDATTPEMKATVAELTKDSKTDLDRVKAVFYHVAQKIRYMGITPEKDRPGFEPHDVKLTFDNKYGVCRDKAALLVSLLEAAGFKTYPVLINVGTKLDMDVPSPDFNHAIVAVELKPRECLTRDHLIPLSRGGGNDWANVVTACSSCNTRKGNHLPHEIGMFPHTPPHEPHFVHLSWAVRRLTPIQAKYIRLFYGEEALRALGG